MPSLPPTFLKLFCKIRLRSALTLSALEQSCFLVSSPACGQSVKSSLFDGILLLCCLLLGALLSICAGQDDSWDLRNYHLYNTAAIFDHRSGLDFFASDKHSGLNPLLDFMYVYLSRGPLANLPRVLAGLMGFWYGLLLFVLGKIVRLLCGSLFARTRPLVLILLLVTAASGAVTLSQIGTTSNDIAETFLLLSGLWIIFKAVDDEKPFASLRPFLSAGMIFGLAAGAKLTGLIFLPPVLAALLATFPTRRGLRATIGFASSWLLGFGVAFGWWGWRLWTQFRNPFYPMLNEVFGSPSGPQLNLTDTRFFPHSPIQWFLYPFCWAFTTTKNTVIEFDFRDPRMAFGLMTVTLFLVGHLFKENGLWMKLKPSQKICFLFWAFSYVVWLLTSSILRYALVLEILAIPLAIVLTHALLRRFLPRAQKLALIDLNLGLCAICLLATVVPQWGHRPFEKTVFSVDLSWTKPRTLFLGLYEPASYLAAFFPENAEDQYVGLAFLDYVTGWPLESEGRRLIDRHEGPIVALLRPSRLPLTSLLSKFGLIADFKTCRTLKSSLEPPGGEPLLACEVSRAR